MPPLRDGAQPNLFFQGRYGVCRIEIIGHEPIQPGQTGNILVRAMFDDSARDSLVPGAEFELRHGPLKPWAVCRISNILEIKDDRAR